MFTFRDAVSGEGFLAGITLSGRALMLKEDGEWWINGVRPAAISETGETPQETFLRFRNRYKDLLFDVAAECRDFDSFRAEVERFFYEPDAEEERRWEEALMAIQLKKVTLEKPFSDLKHEAPENRPTQITVERLDVANKRFMPSDNVSDTYAIPAAA